MYFLNYIYFIIITFLGLKFLTQKQVLLKSPLNKGQTMVVTGPEMFWILTFSTGLLALSAPGTIDLMAIRLLVLEIFCVVGLFLVKDSPVLNITFVFYLIYIVWLIIGLFYSPAPSYGFRVILKYLYPLLIMLFASTVVRDKEVFLKAGLYARILGVISICVYFIPHIIKLFRGVFWYGTATAINYISLCIFSLTLFYFTDEKKKNMFFTILFMIPCLLWVLRTSIMGTIFALSVFFLFKYKLRSLPILFAIVIAGITSVFAIPSLKEKMFKNDNVTIEQLQNGQISKDDINSNARFLMWEHLMEKFYDGREITGSGSGCVQNYMYNNYIFGGVKVPHNDYVQMMCDNGIIAIILYLLIGISSIIHCFIIFNCSNDGAIKSCAIIAGSSMAGVFLTMVSDNVVNYSMATLSMPFGFYGMMLGLLKGAKVKYPKSHNDH